MKSSAAVGLLVISSISLLGLRACMDSPGDEPTSSDLTWVNGQQGIYDINTHQFVPIGSPGFNAAWALILAQRRQYQYSNSYWGGGVSYSGGGSHFFGGAHEGGSARGGFGGFGHGFGGGHA